MITVRTRKQTYTVDADYEEFAEELNSNRTPYIEINGEMIRKSEITSVKDSAVSHEPATQLPDFQLSPEKRQENLYVLTYMKAHIPRHMKKMGRRLSKDEIRAIIAEARVSYADERV